MTNLDDWDYSVQKFCGGFDTKPHSSLPFLGEITFKNHGGLGVAHIETNAQKIDRVSSPHFTNEDQNYFVILQQKGSMGFCNSDENEFLLHPGDIALIDSSTQYSMFPQGLIKQMSVHIPKCVLDEFGRNHQYSFSKLSKNSISNSMLSAILRQLEYSIESYCEGEGLAIQQAISAFIQPSLTLGNNQNNYTLQNAVKQNILRLLPDETLSPDKVAKEMGMSKRSLYRLFSEENISIAGLILTLRIEQCCKDLAQSKMLHQSLSFTEVAFRWGFSDSSHFSRVFKRIKGMSPREWREEI